MSRSSRHLQLIRGERKSLKIEVHEGDVLLDLTGKNIVVFISNDEIQETLYSWSSISHPTIVKFDPECPNFFIFNMPIEVSSNEGVFVFEYKILDPSDILIKKVQFNFHVSYSLEFLPPGSSNQLPPGINIFSPVIIVDTIAERDALTSVIAGTVVYVHDAGPDLFISELNDPDPSGWISLINESVERGGAMFGISIVADIAERDAFTPIRDGKPFFVLNAGVGSEFHIAEVDISNNITWHVIGGGGAVPPTVAEIEALIAAAFSTAFPIAFDASFPVAFAAAFPPAFTASFNSSFPTSFTTAFNSVFPSSFDARFATSFATNFPLSFNPSFDARLTTSFAGHFNPSFDARFITSFATNIADYYTKVETDLTFGSGNQKILENVQMEQINQVWNNGNLQSSGSTTNNNMGVSPFLLVPVGKRPILRVSGEATIGGSAGEYFALRIIFKDSLNVPFEEKIIGVKSYQSATTSPVNYKIDEEFVLYGLPTGVMPANFTIEMSALFPSSLSLGTYSVDFKIQTVGYID